MNELQSAIIERTKIVVDKNDIQLECRLLEDLMIDSFAFIRLIVDLESHLNIMFDDADLVIEQFPTVYDLYEYISQLSDEGQKE